MDIIKLFLKNLLKCLSAVVNLSSNNSILLHKQNLKFKRNRKLKCTYIVIGKGANVNIQVEHGDINMNAVDVRINMNCAEDFNIICGGEFNVISKGDFSINSGDDITLQGDKIFLN